MEVFSHIYWGIEKGPKLMIRNIHIVVQIPQFCFETEPWRLLRFILLKIVVEREKKNWKQVKGLLD